MEEDEPAPTLELQLESLRARVSELGDNPANLVAIADWCAATYVQPGEDRAATVERVQEYLKDALLTVTQQVASSGSALSAFLEQQSLELQSLDATMRLLENRLSSQKEQLARSAMVGQFARLVPPKRDEIAAVAEAPQRASVYRSAAGTIDFDALEKVGTSLPQVVLPPAPPPSSRAGKPKPPPPPDDEDDGGRRKKKPPPPPPPDDDEPSGRVQPGRSLSRVVPPPPPPPEDDEDDGSRRSRKPPPPPPPEEEYEEAMAEQQPRTFPPRSFPPEPRSFPPKPPQRHGSL